MLRLHFSFRLLFLSDDQFINQEIAWTLFIYAFSRLSLWEKSLKWMVRFFFFKNKADNKKLWVPLCGGLQHLTISLWAHATRGPTLDGGRLLQQLGGHKDKQEA